MYNEGYFCQFFFIFSFLQPSLKCDALFCIFLFHQFKSLPDSFEILSFSTTTFSSFAVSLNWQVKLVVQFSSSYSAKMMEVIFLLSRCSFLEYVTHYGGFYSHCMLSEESFHNHHHHHLRIRRALFSFWELTNEAEKRTMSNVYEYLEQTMKEHPPAFHSFHISITSFWVPYSRMRWDVENTGKMNGVLTHFQHHFLINGVHISSRWEIIKEKLKGVLMVKFDV